MATHSSILAWGIPWTEEPAWLPSMESRELDMTEQLTHTHTHTHTQTCKLTGFPAGSSVKNPPANAGDLVRSLSWEDPLEKEVATHSSILAWGIPWTEEPGGL